MNGTGGGLRDWPVSARVAAGVLSALVLVFALTTFLASGRHDKTKLQSSPPSTTTTTTGATSDTAFLTTTPSSTSTTSTTSPQPPPTPAGQRGNGSASGGGGTVTANPPATTTVRPSTTTTPGSSTTSTTVLGGSYCRATLSDPRPAASSIETLTVTSTVASRDVTIVIHYRNNDIAYPSPGEQPFVTDSSGKATVKFTVAQGSKDYPVIVDVAVGGPSTTCETNFRPSS